MNNRFLVIAIVIASLSFLLISCEKSTTEPDTIETPHITFTPPEGVYTTAQSVAISCDVPGAQIHYTTDGSAPDINSILYGSPISIGLNSSMLIRAKYYKEGIVDTVTYKAQYTITGTVDNPVISPTSGTFTSAQNITITCATIGSQIRFTTDNTEPTENSTLYQNPIRLTQTTTLKVKVFKNQWVSSPTFTNNYTINIPIPTNFVQVNGGTFNNGSSNVTVSSFYIDKYELTQADYQAVMTANHVYDYGTGNNYPAYYLTWFDAIEYCNRRSIAEGCTPCYSYKTANINYGTNPSSWPSSWNKTEGNHTYILCNWNANGYRLPTEAEWEYAARGGTLTHNYNYSGGNDLNLVAWYNLNSGNTTHAIGTKTANELGIYDMSGNVWEWVWDIYGTYPTTEQINPHGANSGFYRVVRSSSFDSNSNYCSISVRNGNTANGDYNDLGLRLVRSSQ